MTEAANDILGLARALGEQSAGGSLPPRFAKLYSQHTLLDAGQKGLAKWGRNEAKNRLADAVRLVDAALVQKQAGDEHWYESMLRAAELLEWLAHPSLNADDVPMHLLSAAAYQLAGYPARASGLLSVSSDGANSEVVTSFLRSDFPRLLQTLTHIWSTNARYPATKPRVDWASVTEASSQLQRVVEDEMTSALGVFCGVMRWGDNPRMEIALAKLDAVAKFMLNGSDRYSWLLAKLVAEAARTFINTSLRRSLEWLPEQLDEVGKQAVERYLRQAYKSCKSQAWPSQARGIARLASGDSFVLCTPTGSGKTTVAEIAILQQLFSGQTGNNGAPLVMYLVPKRALAAEVEARLQRVIAPLSQERVVITGLYGGIDWGPTDAWLTSEDRTVLICTYEKAEALIRFLGPLFLNRLSLVVLDEAHMIQFDGKDADLQSAESRPLRLESLIARLFVHIPADQSRIIALSAVAAGMESTLAKWVTGDNAAVPERTLYRSTRQLIGRLECRKGRAFDIRYDLLDRAKLQFEEGDAGTPFIPSAFPPHPPAPSFEKLDGPQKRLRPYLFWAAMNLVSPQGSASLHAVLISIPQMIGGYAQDLLDLLEKDWADVKKPVVFRPPTTATKLDKWQRCLRACEDYFGKGSREYRLLEKGIVAHHGKMPGLMARLLIQLIDEGIVHLVMATSTLSDGINLPFESVLLPTLRRGKEWYTAREFANLAGRAGRPGFGTEGKCLVLMSADSQDYTERQLKKQYDTTIAALAVRRPTGDSNVGGNSALAALLNLLRKQWETLANSTDDAEFIKWLEVTATLPSSPNKGAPPGEVIETLDSLDSILLAAIVEIESLGMNPLSSSQIEAKLVEIWRRCYAYFASQEESTLSKWFLRRGRALVERIYPDPKRRRQLYRTGLPPRMGDQLMQLYPSIREHLITGADYVTRDSDGQFEFIVRLVEFLDTHPKFALKVKTPGRRLWQDLLRWWLDPTGPIDIPTATQVSEWYDYVANNFGYRFAWGIGCVLSLAANEAHGDVLKPTTLEEWPEAGLPWIALWLKELMVWGTLDPVSAYLLGRAQAGTRTEARALAETYYRQHKHLEPDAQLDPRTIRKWAENLPRTSTAISGSDVQPEFHVTLARVFPQNRSRRWRVIPTVVGDEIRWVDLAGYHLATTDGQAKWIYSLLDDGDFILDPKAERVSYSPSL